MIGAIAGDIIGSVYEGRTAPGAGFPLFVAGSRFTDDSVLTVAIASAIRGSAGYAPALRAWGRGYPRAGYGAMFMAWLRDGDAGPYNSWGNGSAMRVSPVAWAFDDLETVLDQAAKSAAVTHDHPEGIRGAQATAAAVFVGRTTRAKEAVLDVVRERFGYDSSASTGELRDRAVLDLSCQWSVPAALAAVREATGVEDAIRRAVSIGGDTDTIACIAGAIAEALFGGVPDAMATEALGRLDGALRDEALAFARAYRVPIPGTETGDGR